MNVNSTDTQYWETKIKSVATLGEGTGCTITGEDGWSIFVGFENCSEVPKEGELIRFYGEYGVRGIVIEGRVYRYQSQELFKAVQAEERARYEREQVEIKEAFRASKKPALAQFKLRDPSSWKATVEVNSVDPYSFRVMQYAADWASFMEREMSKGSTIGDCAEQTSREADTDGITGFMYGAAVSVLSQVWEYGDELRRWHNLKTEEVR